MVKLAISYLIYRLFAPHRRGFGVHSPFVFHLVRNVLNRKDDEKLEQIAVWRRKIMTDGTLIDTSDVGAGSYVHYTKRRSIKQIARKSSIRHKYGRILYLLAREFKPATIIELGTGIGISTAYLAMASPQSRLISIDDDGEKMKFAERELEHLGLKNVSLKKGLFGKEISKALQSALHPVMVYLDGDHSYEGTMMYFEEITKYLNAETILIIDDIRWSDSMEKAWLSIKQDPATILSIDLFFMGILFFRSGITRQDFVINY